MKENHTAATGTVCNSEVFTFPAVKRRTFTASFTGGEGTSDGGIALLRQTDRRIGLTKAPAKVLPDPLDPGRIKHPLLSLIRQRLCGLAAGYGSENLRAGVPRLGQRLNLRECCPRHADQPRG